MSETVWNTFKVFDMKKLTEKEARLVAGDHFMDVVSTFGLKSSNLYMVSTNKLETGEKVYNFEIRQENVKKV